MFHRDLIGDDILDIGSSKWSLSDKDGEDYRADIQGAPSNFMVPSVANVSLNEETLTLLWAGSPPRAARYSSVSNLSTSLIFQYVLCSLPSSVGRTLAPRKGRTTTRTSSS